MKHRIITVKGNAFRSSLQLEDRVIKLDQPIEYIIEGYFWISKLDNGKYRLHKNIPTKPPILVPFGKQRQVNLQQIAKDYIYLLGKFNSGEDLFKSNEDLTAILKT